MKRFFDASCKQENTDKMDIIAATDLHFLDPLRTAPLFCLCAADE